MKTSFVHKFIIAILIVISISTIFTKQVHAIDLEALGGLALDHILSLFVAIGDGVMGVIQETIIGMDESLININTETVWWAEIAFWIILIGAAVIGVTSVILTGGASLTFIGVVKGIIAGASVIIKIGVIGYITFPIATQIGEGMLGDNFYLSLYQVTPYEIFSNKLLALDANFFDPMDNQTNYTKKKQTVNTLSKKFKELEDNYGFSSLEETYHSEDDQGDVKYTYYVWDYEGRRYQLTKFDYRTSDYLAWNCESYNKKDGGDEKWIFGNETELIYENDTEIEIIKEETGETVSTAKQLRDTVSQWYYTLRNIAILISMVVLLYIGIRIITSSVSDNKAKYKQMLADWLISICLIFMMQYIMIFANYFVDLIIEIIDSMQVNTEEIEVKGGNLEEIEENYQGVELFLIDDSKKVEKAYEVLVGEGETEFKRYFFTSGYQPASGKSDAEILIWPAENFMQQARLKFQLLEVKEDENGKVIESTERTASIGWKLIFVVLVVYTVIFLWTYLKRIVYLAFLTIIAPLVALTYPIDKITDGKAQAFDSWLKEYIFNLLIQPMHLFLYMVLVGAAMDFACENIIYVVVALGFITPAEKLIRRFFGFKGETPGKLAGVAGAALMMSGFNKLTHMGGKHGGNLSGGHEGSSKSSKDNDIKTYGASGNYSKYDEAKELLLNEKDGGKSKIKQQDKRISAKEDERNSTPVANGMSDTDRKNEKKGANGKTRDTTMEVLGVSEKEPKTTGRVAKLAGGVLKASGKYIGQRLVNKGNSIRSKKLLGTATGLVGAGIGLTAGAIAGIAGGDPSKAFQYATAGAAGGFVAAKGTGQRVADSFSVNEKQAEEIREAFYGDEYLRKRREMAEKEYKKRKENIEYMKSHLKIDKQEAKKKMNSEATDKALKAGIYDISDIATINKLVDEGMSVKKAVNTAAFKKELKENPKNFGKKAREDAISKLSYNLESHFGKDAQGKAEQILDKVKDYWDVRDDITQDDL